MTEDPDRNLLTPLRLLLAEDSDDDAVLIMRELEAGGYRLTSTRVETARDFEQELAVHDWDLVISDYSMPQFTALDALAILKLSRQPELPFLIVSGSIGEASAVAALKAGASNYLMKDKLAELLPSVQRELKDARMRIERHAAFSALEQAVKARDEFLSIASHELKTPLASLRLQAQSLLRSARGQSARVLDDAQVQRKLELLDRNAERIVVLVERLLDINRVTSGKLQLTREHVDVVEIVKQTLSVMDDMFRATKTPITVDAPPRLDGNWDRDRLEAVVGNLVSNAVRYGAGKPVRIELVDDGTRAVLRVIDMGIGISAQDMPRIFGRFERAVTETHGGGLGVGLWLAKQIVEAHGGTIGVTSELLQGSTFTVILPKDGTQ